MKANAGTSWKKLIKQWLVGRIKQGDEISTNQRQPTRKWINKTNYLTKDTDYRAPLPAPRYLQTTLDNVI